MNINGNGNEKFEKEFNEYRLSKFTASDFLTADELMSWYEGEEGKSTVQLQPYVSNPKLIYSKRRRTTL